MGSQAVRRAGREKIRKARKFIRLARHSEFRAALRLGVAAAIEHESVTFEHEFGSVIDVGAHNGQFALFAAHRYPSASLYCFEPLPTARNRLERVFRKDPRLTAFPVALGSRQQDLPMHVAGRDDSSSLLAITDRCVDAFPGTTESHMLDVQTVRLDEALGPEDIRRPALLKIDVQGYELEVLHGSEGLLGCVDEILVELSFVELYYGQPLAAEVVAFLHAHAFSLTGVFGTTRDRAGRCLQADFLFCSRTPVPRGAHSAAE